MANIGVTPADVFIPEIWSAETIKAVEDNLVLTPLVWNFDSEAKMGDTIHVPSVSNFVANNKVENLPTTPQAPTETNVDITIDQHKETTFFIEDIAEVQAKNNLMSLYTDKAGFAIAEAMDTSLASLFAAFSQTKGSYNTAITTDVILDSIEVLDLVPVPETDRYFCFRPDVKRDLLDLAAYTSSDYVDGKPVQSGNIGSLYGIQTFQSTNLVKSGSNTDNAIFHKHALAIARQILPRTQSDYDLAYLGHRVTVDCVYGVKEMRDNHGVLVKT